MKIMKNQQKILMKNNVCCVMDKFQTAQLRNAAICFVGIVYTWRLKTNSNAQNAEKAANLIN